MKKQVFFVMFCVLFFSYEMYAASNEDVKEDVIVYVGDTPITHHDLYNRLYKFYGHQALSQMLEELLIKKEASARGIKVPEKEVQERINDIKKQFEDEEKFQNFLTLRKMTLGDLKEQIRLDILKRKMIIKDKKIKISSKQIKEFFENNKEKFAIPEQVKLRDILVKTQKEAEDLILAIKAGAEFSTLCKAKSLDTATKDNGGDLGYFTRGVLAKEIEDIVFNLKEGEIAPPVKTKSGWHVIQVVEKRDATPAKLDKEIKEQIREFLLNQQINAAYAEWINELNRKWSNSAKQSK